MAVVSIIGNGESSLKAILILGFFDTKSPLITSSLSNVILTVGRFRSGFI